MHFECFFKFWVKYFQQVIHDVCIVLSEKVILRHFFRLLSLEVGL